jgi:hypothetical protein
MTFQRALWPNHPGTTDQKRTSEGGRLMIAMIWDKAAPSEVLVFSVVMDTHFARLDAITMAKQAQLRADDGRQAAPLRWQARAGGHHRPGTLSFPLRIGTADVIGPQTKSIEFIVRDVSGLNERSFEWEVAW